MDRAALDVDEAIFDAVEAIPPGRVSTSRASPPSAGRLHRAGFGSPSSPVAAGSGRAEVNSSEPSGAQEGSKTKSPSRETRRAHSSPVGSTITMC